MKMVPVVGWVSALGIAMGVALTAMADMDSDHDQDQEIARELVLKGEILPLESVVITALQRHQGRLIEVELETLEGRYVYEVGLVTHDGEKLEYYYDARTGELLFIHTPPVPQTR